MRDYQPTQQEENHALNRVGWCFADVWREYQNAPPELRAQVASDCFCFAFGQSEANETDHRSQDFVRRVRRALDEHKGKTVPTICTFP